MKCPRCRSSEINLFGLCLICGYEVSQSNKEEAAFEEDEQNFLNIIDTMVSSRGASSPESDALPCIPETESPAFPEIDTDEVLATPLGAQTSRPLIFEKCGQDDRAPSIIGGFESASDESAVDGLFVAEDDTPYVSVARDDAYISDVVDDVKTEDAAETANVAAARDVAYAGNSRYAAANAPDPEGRLIFLSRTLSGLVDLFLISLFSGIFLCMADYFTNAPMLNSMSAINFAALFLMIYFLYSIFFLGTNSQTIGMMVADLRVAGINKSHFSMSQIIRRCAMFLVSLFGLGIGLLAGVFSGKCLCLHDRFSGTRVVRILKHTEV
jgi:uncharacterized RDD family membrane protein YckC